MKQFLELNQAWQNKKQMDIDQCYKNQIDTISFRPKIKNRIDTVQIIAITTMTINMVIPFTVFPITNPIIYRKIVKNLNSHKIRKFFDKLKIKYGW